MGLDRIPEAKTIRNRISAFCRQTHVEEWLSLLSKEWIQTTDYWINDRGALWKERKRNTSKISHRT
jgi:hypothetical protein